MPFYAGFDCSTQSLTAIVVDSTRRETVFRESLAFPVPFLSSVDASVVHASPNTWADALADMLERVARALPREALRAISGSAQQHGSVYCGDTPDVLTRETSPIWMDSSASRECDEIERALGGPRALADLTGSRAFPRFTGAQIRKFATHERSAYEKTARIHLVSSFLASLLVGHHAPLDHADGSGMNLMDLRTRQWSPAALRATAPDLERRLPPLVSSAAVVGNLAPKWQARTGLGPVPIVAWSGDNPCSLVGTGLVSHGQLAISLGTSDTVFGPMEVPRVSAEGIGHVFASPLDGYMGITVFRNGSLARERVRDQFGMSWQDFSAALRQTPAGNNGGMMLPWFEPEITPDIPTANVHRFDLDAVGPAHHVRALVEAQAMALARHSCWMGVKPEVIYATGGAAANRDILQVIADVFDVEVFQFESTDSAALGAALRAWQSDSGLPWQEVVKDFAAPLAGSRVAPTRAHCEIYQRLKPLHAAREAAALAFRR